MKTTQKSHKVKLNDIYRIKGPNAPDNKYVVVNIEPGYISTKPVESPRTIASRFSEKDFYNVFEFHARGNIENA